MFIAFLRDLHIGGRPGGRGGVHLVQVPLLRNESYDMICHTYDIIDSMILYHMIVYHCIVHYMILSVYVV